MHSRLPMFPLRDRHVVTPLTGLFPIAITLTSRSFSLLRHVLASVYISLDAQRRRRDVVRWRSAAVCVSKIDRRAVRRAVPPRHRHRHSQSVSVPRSRRSTSPPASCGCCCCCCCSWQRSFDPLRIRRRRRRRHAVEKKLRAPNTSSCLDGLSNWIRRKQCAETIIFDTSTYNGV